MSHIPFFKPDLGQDEADAATGALMSGVLTQGPHVQMFEQAFAAYQDVKHAVAVNSCTSALFLTLKGLGVGPGHEVITSPISWVATALAIRMTGARVVFGEVDWRGMLTPASAERLVTPKTAAIVPVHLYGRLADVEGFQRIRLGPSPTGHHPIVWDCAHAIESRYGDRPAGSYGAAACYSFFGSKNLTTAGEGGAVVTDDPDLATYVRRARIFGLTYPEKQCTQFGGKFNMTEVQGAVGRVQLGRLEANLAKRRVLAKAYSRHLNYTPPEDGPGVQRAHHLFAIQLASDLLRSKVIAALTANHIGHGIHYAPIYDHPAFENERPAPEARVVADGFGATTLSLPFFPSMTEDQVSRVAAVVREAIA